MSVKVLDVPSEMTVEEVLAEAEMILDAGQEIRVDMVPADVTTRVQPGQQIALVPKVRAG